VVASSASHAASASHVTSAIHATPTTPDAHSTRLTARGIIISTHIDGTDWGSDTIVSTMRDIKAVGATWVATHPYGFIRGDGAVRSLQIDPEDPPAWLTRPIEEAHALGLKILIKPHLGYWGSPFRWRGEIDFDSAAAWERFWYDYEQWIVALAEACSEADAFVIGTELVRTLEHERRWRQIIARIREKTPVPLTYAANWDSYERVPFWDALDVIGIQAYFPLSDRESPDEQELTTAWQLRMEQLRDFAGEQDRCILFSELGYSRSFHAAMHPWSHEDDGQAAEHVQTVCMRAALRAVENEPSVIGAFLWKWFPNPYPIGRNFQLATPGMKRVIAHVWRGDGG
jgi:hypothetical protein